MLDTVCSADFSLDTLIESFTASDFVKNNRDLPLGGTVTVGDLADKASASSDVQAQRDKEITVTTTIGKVFDLVGEENLQTRIEELAGKAGYNPLYEFTRDNVLHYWALLIRFVLAFAALATITLEFIDKDKR